MTHTKNFAIVLRPWTSQSQKKHADIKTSNPVVDDMASEENFTDQGGDVSKSTSTSSLSIKSMASSQTSHASSQTSLHNSKRQDKIDFSSLQHLIPDSQKTVAGESPLWYILTTALLLSFHKEKLVGDLWSFLAHLITDTDAQLAAARRIREACLKSSTLVGFPRAINALISLKSAIETTTPHLSSLLTADASPRAPLSSEKYERGMNFFTQIYQQHSSRVIRAMDETSGGDLTHFAINCIYGELLSDHSIIGALHTGLLEFVCCLADGCAPQAKGHFFGSINLGATGEELRGSVVLTQEIASSLGIEPPWLEDGDVEYKFLDRVLKT